MPYLLMALKRRLLLLRAMVKRSMTLTQPREHEAAGQKTLETFEQEAFAALEKKKGKCFKRPAAAPKASTKASAKAKGKVAGTVAGHLKFGLQNLQGYCQMLQTV